MQINWGYFWRNVGFHIVWYTLAPIAGLFSASRGYGGVKRASERMDLVYESMKKKYVLRPLLAAPLRNIKDDDLETLIWLSQEYPFSLQEVAEIWESQGRMVGLTIQQIEARMIGMKVKLKR